MESSGSDRGGHGAEASLPMNQRARQKAETRRRLIEAATEVFLQHPPMTAPLEEIAGRAGVRRETLLYHFGNRTGLMYEVMRHHLRSFEAQVSELGTELAPFLELYLRAQTLPLVRLVRQLSDLLYHDMPPDEPGTLLPGTWYPIMAGNLESRLVEAGISAEEAQRRTPVFALALEAMAKQVAWDPACEGEIPNFVDTVCDLMLAPTAKRSAGPQDQETWR
jgi:AcrR family transcriptional regulator